MKTAYKKHAAPTLLKFTSCQSENADFFCRAVCDYIGKKLGIATQFIDNMPWQERERQFYAGDVHAAWICGLPYVLKADAEDCPFELLAAPVMAAGRYANRPVYFSDIVVHRDCPAESFEALRGKSWAYNEPRSHSGYNLARYHLAMLGEMSDYFGRVLESGAHLSTLRMILRSEVDASAIDSMVLELEFARQPALRNQVRIVETLGPSPAPPWVVRKDLCLEFRSVTRSSPDDA